jgi:hypothetical protein
VQLADFLIGKHPNMKLAAISSAHDEIMRLFFSMGLGDCATIETADPVAITVAQGSPGVYYPAEDYAAGVKSMLALYGDTNRLAAYGYGGFNLTLHQHTFRNRFYEPLTNGMSAAQFVTQFLAGTVQEVLPTELQ